MAAKVVLYLIIGATKTINFNGLLISFLFFLLLRAPLLVFLTHNSKTLLYKTMNDISEILRALLDQLSNTEEVELWCEDMGYGIKTGYQDFIDEQMRDREDFWDSMSEEL